MSVGESIVLIEKSKEKQLDDFVISSLQYILNATCSIFQRCFVNNILYFLKCYTRTKREIVVLFVLDITRKPLW